MFLFEKRKTDEEHVRNLRRLVEKYDRFRFWLLLLYGLGFIALIILLVMYTKLLPVFIQQANPAWPFLGFVFGIIFGVSYGVLLLGVVHGLMDLIFGLRNERLLLKYHDELYDSGVEETSKVEAEDSFEME